MWGTDMTAAFTRDHGRVAVFVAVDHCSAECVGVHAARRGTRGSAVEDVVHHEAAGSGDAGDDLGEVGGAPGGQRTQRCRLDAHRVLPAAVPPGDAWIDKTHARACFRAFYWRIRREKREIRRCAQRANEGPDRRFYGQEGTDCSASGRQCPASRRDCFHFSVPISDGGTATNRVSAQNCRSDHPARRRGPHQSHVVHSFAPLAAQRLVREPYTLARASAFFAANAKGQGAPTQARPCLRHCSACRAGWGGRSAAAAAVACGHSALLIVALSGSVHPAFRRPATSAFTVSSVPPRVLRSRIAVSLGVNRCPAPRLPASSG